MSDIDRRGFLGLLSALGAAGLIGKRVESKPLPRLPIPNQDTKPPDIKKSVEIAGAKLRGFRNGKWKDLGPLRSIEIHQSVEEIDITRGRWGIGLTDLTHEYMQGLASTEYEVEIEGYFQLDEYEKFEAIISETQKYSLGLATQSDISHDYRARAHRGAPARFITRVQFRAANVRHIE